MPLAKADDSDEDYDHSDPEHDSDMPDIVSSDVKLLNLVTFTMSDSSIDESNHGGLSRWILIDRFQLAIVPMRKLFSSI